MDNRFEIPGYREALELAQEFSNGVSHIDGVHEVSAGVRRLMNLPGFARETHTTVWVSADLSGRETRTALYEGEFRFRSKWPDARVDIRLIDPSSPRQDSAPTPSPDAVNIYRREQITR